MRAAVTFMLLIGTVVVPQTAAAQVRRGTLETPNEVDPGVLAATLLENADVWVSRVQVRPGSTRRVHQHNDVAYHLMMPIDGSLQLTGGEKPTEARPWQVIYMKSGTPHGFQNTGATTVTLIEVLVRSAKQARILSSDIGSDVIAQVLITGSDWTPPSK